MKKMISPVLGFLFGLLFLTACDDGGKNTPDDKQNDLPADVRDASTIEMAAMLAKIPTKIPPLENSYTNAARVDYYRVQQRNPPPEKIFEYNYMLGQELLNAGRTQDAINQLSYIIDMMSQDAGLAESEPMYGTRELLALAYMRLGEQENCVINHSSESCIFPVSGNGIHSIERGSRAAIAELTKILKYNPNSLDSRWLINIAYQTLGEYPDKVPEQYLIPPESFASDIEFPRFSDIAPHIGLDTKGLLGSAVTEDFDNDGYLDVMASAWGLNEQLRFYKNKGDGTFTERTGPAGLVGLVGGINLVQADYNNDGFVDVFVLRGAWYNKYGKMPNSLLRNNGDGTFSDVTKAAGVFSLYPTQTAAWGDFNNDGFVDLYIGNESTEAFVNRCELYVNNGDGTFREAAAEAGVDASVYAKGVVWADYDRDGLLDLYVSNHYGDNLLFHNDGPDESGAWHFTDMAKKAGVTEPFRSFPAWWFDYDNDGWEDIFVSGYSGNNPDFMAAEVAAFYLGKGSEAERPRLYRNNGNGTFSNVTKAVGLDEPFFTMGCNFGDLDNDGWLDFYLGTGEPDYRSIIPNRMLRNNNGKNFQDVTTAGGFGHLQKGHGVSFADMDHDGDQDIYTVIGGAYEGDVFQNAFFENPGFGKQWVTLVLEGKTVNRSAIGAWIKVTAGGREIYRTVNSGGSFGANTLRQEIGLGDATTIDKIEITWPGIHQSQVFENVTPGKIYKITEGDAKLSELSAPKFEFSKGSGGHQHQH